MIFMSVQPDEKYFIWQLEVQLYNFKRLGIDPSNIHILFVSQMGSMSEDYKRFYRENPDVKIFWYKDKRRSKRYIPSLRPNGLKQHFEAHPELVNEAIFYHDADIIFRELPDFDSMLKDNVWYLSNTNSYINADYIKSKGDNILKEMCSIVGVQPSAVEAINEHSGGAQYLMKNVDAAFWDKVELDCENLYSYMVDSVPYWAEKFAKKSGLPKEQYHEIQAWTADMWCVLWNAIMRGNEVRVVPELDFSFATDAMETYNKKKIFHNAGVCDGDKHRLFYKGSFIHEPPFDINLSFVDQHFASAAYVNEINDYVKSKVN